MKIESKCSQNNCFRNMTQHPGYVAVKKAFSTTFFLTDYSINNAPMISNKT